MRNAIFTQAMGFTTHPAIASMECFKLVTSMEDALAYGRQAQATVGLLESISGMDDQAKAEELLGHVAVMQGVSPDSVSMESLGSLIAVVRKLFGRKKKTTEEKEPSKEPEELKELMAFLNKYYLNATWLNKQEFVQGTVSGEGLAEKLTRDKKFNDATLVKDFVKYATEFTAFMDKHTALLKDHAYAVLHVDNELVAAVEALDKQSPDYEKQVLDLTRQYVKKFRALALPSDWFAKSRFKFMGNVMAGDKKWPSGEVSAASVDQGPVKPVATVAPVSNTQDVIALAKACIAIYEAYSRFDNTFFPYGDHSDGKHRWCEVVEYADEKLWQEYMNEMDHHGHADIQTRYINYEDHLTGAVIAILKWIDRSIKAE
jgi:hypothetical protein